MKIVILFVFSFALVISPSLSSQTYWKRYNINASGPVEGITTTSNGNIFVATMHSGLIKSYDNGESWQKDTLSFFQAYDVIVTSTDDLFLGIGGWAYIYRSSNFGNTWLPVGTGTDLPLALASSLSGDIFVGTDSKGVLFSTNSGQNWESIGLENFQRIRHIAISKSGDIYASGYGGTIFRTTNRGQDWDDLSGTFPDYQIFSITTDRNGGVYIGARHPGIPPSVFPDGVVFISRDDGNTWKTSRTINWDLNVVGVAVTTTGDLIMITSNAGIWRSTDDGDTWSEFNDGYVHGGGNCVYTAPNGRIFVGASGANYELMGYPVSNTVQQTPTTLALAQSYPNPVSTTQSAYINFELPTEEYITLTVYNTTGQQVRTIAQGTYQPGTHIAQFTPSDLPAGVYLYRLTAGDRVQSRLLQIIK